MIIPEANQVASTDSAAGLCESEAAIDLVQERNRDLLTTFSRGQPELHREICKSFDPLWVAS